MRFITIDQEKVVSILDLMDCRVKTQETLNSHSVICYVSILDLMDCRVKTLGGRLSSRAKKQVSILDLMDCRVKTTCNHRVECIHTAFQSLI